MKEARGQSDHVFWSGLDSPVIAVVSVIINSALVLVGV